MRDSIEKRYIGKIIGCIFLITSFVAVSSCSQSGYQITGNLESEILADKVGTLTDIFLSYNLNVEYVLLIAGDGTAVFLSEKSFPDLEVIRSKGKYSTKSESLPPVCNLSGVVEIAIYNNTYRSEDIYTPFYKKMENYQLLGESSMKGHIVRKYQAIN